MRSATGHESMAYLVTAGGVCSSPDVRIEYDIDGREHTLDVEVMTPHYRGAHAASKSSSGFKLYWTASTGGGQRGGHTPSIMEELL